MHLQYIALQNLACSHSLTRSVEVHKENPRQITYGWYSPVSLKTKYVKLQDIQIINKLEQQQQQNLH